MRFAVCSIRLKKRRAYSQKGNGLFVFATDDFRLAPHDRGISLCLPAEVPFTGRRRGRSLSSVVPQSGT